MVTSDSLTAPVAALRRCTLPPVGWRSSRLSAPLLVLALLVGAALLRLTWGEVVLGYDTAAALLWGDDLAHGRLPDFTSPYSPTPHPLAYVALVAAAPFGQHAHLVVEAIMFGCFAFLGWAGFRLGQALFSPAVGVVFTLLLLTRPLLVSETVHAFVDIPSLALVLLAAALEAERRRRGMPVLVLLSLAGLLRPEAWLLAAAYAVWCMPGRTTRERAGLALAAASAPLLWATLDLIIAGDPLFSLHSTQDAAASLGRPTGLANALELMPTYLSDVVEAPIVWVGIVGFAVCLYLLYERSLVLGAILTLGLASFLGLGLADLPLLRRYLLPAAAVLALFCAAAALGWHLLDRNNPRRKGWALASVAVAAVVAASLPATAADISDGLRFRNSIKHAQGELLDLLYARPAQAAAARCPNAYVPDTRLGTTVGRALDKPLDHIHERNLPKPTDRGVIVVPTSPAVGPYYVERRDFRLYGPGDLRGFRPVDENELWAVWARC